MNPLAYGGLVILLSVCFFGCLTSVMGGTSHPYFNAMITIFVTHWVLRDLVPIRQEEQKNNDDV